MCFLCVEILQRRPFIAYQWVWPGAYDNISMLHDNISKEALTQMTHFLLLYPGSRKTHAVVTRSTGQTPDGDMALIIPNARRH